MTKFDLYLKEYDSEMFSSTSSYILHFYKSMVLPGWIVFGGTVPPRGAFYMEGKSFGVRFIQRDSPSI